MDKNKLKIDFLTAICLTIAVLYVTKVEVLLVVTIFAAS